MKRLGGIGLDAKQTAALAAYLEAVPRGAHADARRDAVARGKELFESTSSAAGAATTARCTPTRTATSSSGTLPESDTPSLIGLAASAPYFHDGSAATLEALLRDRGAVHGMAETAKLSDEQVADLTAFLETL